MLLKILIAVLLWVLLLNLLNLTSLPSFPMPAGLREQVTDALTAQKSEPWVLLEISQVQRLQREGSSLSTCRPNLRVRTEGLTGGQGRCERVVQVGWGTGWCREQRMGGRHPPSVGAGLSFILKQHVNVTILNV